MCMYIYIYIILTSKDIEHIGLDLENLGTEILGVYIYIYYSMCVALYGHLHCNPPLNQPTLQPALPAIGHAMPRCILRSTWSAWSHSAASMAEEKVTRSSSRCAWRGIERSASVMVDNGCDRGL